MVITARCKTKNLMCFFFQRMGSILDNCWGRITAVSLWVLGIPWAEKGRNKHPHMLFLFIVFLRYIFQLLTACTSQVFTKKKKIYIYIYIYIYILPSIYNLFPKYLRDTISNYLQDIRSKHLQDIRSKYLPDTFQVFTRYVPSIRQILSKYLPGFPSIYRTCSLIVSICFEIITTPFRIICSAPHILVQQQIDSFIFCSQAHRGPLGRPHWGKLFAYFVGFGVPWAERGQKKSPCIIRLPWA